MTISISDFYDYENLYYNVEEDEWFDDHTENTSPSSILYQDWNFYNYES